MKLSKHPKSKLLNLTLILSLIIGIGLRMYLIQRNDIWFDEASTWNISTNYSLSDILQGKYHDAIPPLYFAITRIITTLFTSNQLTLRSVSLISNLLITTVMYLYIVKKNTKQAKLLTSLLLLNPFLIWYSTEARPYSLTITIATLSLLCHYTWLKKGRSKMLFLATILGFLGIFSSLSYIFVFTSLVFISTLHLIYKKQIKKLTPLLLHTFTFIVTTATIFYFLWQDSAMLQSVFEDTLWYPQMTPLIFVRQTAELVSLYKSYNPTIISIWIALSVFVLFAVPASVVYFKSKFATYIYLVLISIISLTLASSILVKPAYLSRQIGTASLLISIMTGYLLTSSIFKFKLVLATILLILSSISLFSFTQIKRGYAADALSLIDSQEKVLFLTRYTTSYNLIHYYVPDSNWDLTVYPNSQNDLDNYINQVRSGQYTQVCNFLFNTLSDSQHRDFHFFDSTSLTKTVSFKSPREKAYPGLNLSLECYR